MEIPYRGRRSPSPRPPCDESPLSTLFGSPTSVVDLFGLYGAATSHPLNKGIGCHCEHCVEAESCEGSNRDLSLAPSKKCRPNLLDQLTDDLILEILDFLDVKSAVFSFGLSCRKHLVLVRYPPLPPLTCVCSRVLPYFAMVLTRVSGSSYQLETRQITSNFCLVVAVVLWFSSGLNHIKTPSHLDVSKDRCMDPC